MRIKTGLMQQRSQYDFFPIYSDEAFFPNTDPMFMINVALQCCVHKNICQRLTFPVCHASSR